MTKNVSYAISSWAKLLCSLSHKLSNVPVCLQAVHMYIHCVYMYIDSVLLVPAVSMATEFFITNPNDIRKLNDDKSQILYEDSDRPQVMMS